MQPLHVEMEEFCERLDRLADALIDKSLKVSERLRRQDRRVGLTGELPDEWLISVKGAEVPVAHSHLDQELD